MKPPSSMPAVCITGAHRSGTSMLAQLLHARGIYLGPPSALMGASQDNPEGFWEHVGFVALNDDILQACGGSWDLPPEVDADKAELAPLKERGRELVDSMRQSTHWGWKDPRNCLTLPFWREVVPEIRVVVIVRHPLEVAASLHTRNGFSYALAFHLWRTYYQRILGGAEDEAILVTHYDSFFDNADSEMSRVLHHLGIADAKRTTDPNTIVSNVSRHHYATRRQVAEANIPRAILELYRMLLARSNRTSGDSVTHAKAAGQRRRPAKREPVQTSETVAELKTLVAQRTAWAEQAAEEAARLADLTTQLQRELADRATWAKEQDRELERVNAVVHELQAELDDRTRWATALDAQLNEGRPLLEKAIREQQETAASLAKLQKEFAAHVAQAEERIAQLRAQLDKKVARR